MAIIVLVYGLLILVGGIIGHWQAGSMASLLSGLIFGSLLIVASWGMFKSKPWGVWSALFLTFLLDAFFSYRLLITKKFMPSGLLSLISLGVLLLLALSIRKRART